MTAKRHREGDLGMPRIDLPDREVRPLVCGGRGCRRRVASLIFEADVPRRGVVLRVAALRGPRFGHVESHFRYSLPLDRGSSSGDLQLDYFPLDRLDVRCPCGHLNRLDLKVLRQVARALAGGIGQVQAQDP